MITINLATTRTRRRPGLPFRVPRLGVGVVFVALHAVALVGVGATWWALSAEAGRLGADIALASRELDTLKAATGGSDEVKARLAELRQRVQILQGLIRDQAQPILLFDAFADAVPPDVWITAIEEKATSLKVTGAAFSTTAVSDLMSNLRRSGKFKEVDIVIARQDQAKHPPVVTFEVTCRFEG
jgi:Tfp pilus assembly protein PilN